MRRGRKVKGCSGALVALGEPFSESFPVISLMFTVGLWTGAGLIHLNAVYTRVITLPGTRSGT